MLLLRPINRKFRWASLVVLCVNFLNLRRLTGMAQRQSWRCVTKKGGVGKTTSTINLGACLAEAGRRVLLVDLDPQGALSAGLGIPHDDLDLTIYNLLVDNRTTYF